MSTVTLVRHATVVVELGDQRVLIDPMLDAAGARGPIANSPEPRDNPLVDLPPNAGELLAGLTAVVVTHLHEDHLDAAGRRFLDGAGVSVLGQPEDRDRLPEGAAEIGGTLGDVTLHRTGGRHGTGRLADMLGPVSGVVLEHGGARVYVAGDTVRCEAFDAAMRDFEPTTVVLNAGGARFVEGDPITMPASEVTGIAGDHPGVAVVAGHMDAINHCLDTRDVLRAEVERAGVGNVAIPADGAQA